MKIEIANRARLLQLAEERYSLVDQHEAIMKRLREVDSEIGGVVRTNGTSSTRLTLVMIELLSLLLGISLCGLTLYFLTEGRLVLGGVTLILTFASFLFSPFFAFASPSIRRIGLSLLLANGQSSATLLSRWSRSEVRAVLAK